MAMYRVVYGENRDDHQYHVDANSASEAEEKFKNTIDYKYNNVRIFRVERI